MAKTIEIEAVLRSRNQLTLPAQAAERLHVRAGDRVVFELEEDTNRVALRPLRPSYSGALAGAYGDDAEVAAYIKGERAAWD